jgi:mycothiol synthase
VKPETPLTPRPYGGAADLEKMRCLLQAGRQARNGSYYVHVGDLNWWLFYPPVDHELWPYFSLWDDPDDPARLLGWALLDPDWNTFDVYVQPELRGTPLAERMYAWAEAGAAAQARAAGIDRVRTMWIARDDDLLCAQMHQHGFHRTQQVALFWRSLEEPIPEPAVPPGYAVRGMAGEAEAAARAAASYAAFDNSAPFEQYLARFLRFMHSPAYTPELDVVAAAPGDRIGAFCIAWVDAANRDGHFEPVGTHPDFRRMGLGKAVMVEGLRRLQARGMTSASVCTPQDNLPGVRLYESAGFEIVNWLDVYEKALS